jgi:hypothetical protein
MDALQAFGELIKKFSVILELELPVIDVSIGVILLWMLVVLLAVKFLGHIFGMRGGEK